MKRVLVAALLPLTMACVGLRTIGYYANAVLDGEASTTVENAPPLQPNGLRSFGTDSAVVRLFVIGDWGSGSSLQRDVAVAMARIAQSEHPHAIVSTGDNFYPSGVESADDRLFHDRWESVYADSALMVPWIVALGNHDHRGNIAAQIEYSQRNRRWYMPAPYYTARVVSGGTSVMLFVLDTDSLLSDRANRARQLRWLDSALSVSDATVRIVVGHHPVRSYGLYGDTRVLVEQLAPILDRHGVALYLCGHEHDLQIVVHPDDRFACVVSGGGGHARRTRYGQYSRCAWTGGGFAYLVCHRDGSVFVQIVARDGRIVCSDSLPAGVHRQGLEPRTR